MYTEEIALKLHKSLNCNVFENRRVKSVSLQELLEALIEHKTLVLTSKVLGISRSVLTEVCKELFPEKESKEQWSTFLLKMLDKKSCCKCNQILPLDSFADDKTKGKHVMCKPCLSAYGKERYFTDKPKHKEWNDTWRQNNPSKVSESSARRKANKLDQTPESADLKLIQQIYKHCPPFWHVDHVIPLAKGGLHHQDNLCYLYETDNLSKKDKMPEEVPEIMNRAIYPLHKDGGFL